MGWSFFNKRPKVTRVSSLTDDELVERFRDCPEVAYAELLERHSAMLLRMIRRFMRDPDEVMEVYTAVCEKLRSGDYQALRRFRSGSELAPWLSVVVANACRDRFRRKKATSMPRSVFMKLDKRQQLVFRYYYQDRLTHEEIAEIISSKHGVPCTTGNVSDDIQRINELLSVKKRWMLISAINSNRPVLSIDEMAEDGYETPDVDDEDAFEAALRNRETLDELSDALARLSEEDRLLILLRFEQGMTAIQIADVMKYDCHKYVYTRLRTVINRLRRSMDPDIISSAI